VVIIVINENPLKNYIHKKFGWICGAIIHNMIISLVITAIPFGIMLICDYSVSGGKNFEYVMMVAVLFFIISNTLLLWCDYRDY